MHGRRPVCDRCDQGGRQHRQRPDFRRQRGKQLNRQGRVDRHLRRDGGQWRPLLGAVSDRRGRGRGCRGDAVCRRGQFHDRGRRDRFYRRRRFRDYRRRGGSRWRRRVLGAGAQRGLSRHGDRRGGLCLASGFHHQRGRDGLRHRRRLRPDRDRTRRNGCRQSDLRRAARRAEFAARRRRGRRSRLRRARRRLRLAPDARLGSAHPRRRLGHSRLRLRLHRWRGRSLGPVRRGRFPAQGPAVLVDFRPAGAGHRRTEELLPVQPHRWRDAGPAASGAADRRDRARRDRIGYGGIVERLRLGRRLERLHRSAQVVLQQTARKGLRLSRVAEVDPLAARRR